MPPSKIELLCCHFFIPDFNRKGANIWQEQNQIYLVSPVAARRAARERSCDFPPSSFASTTFSALRVTPECLPGFPGSPGTSSGNTSTFLTGIGEPAPPGLVALTWSFCSFDMLF